jgi:hypothetical protein
MRFHWLIRFCAWLEGTSVSETIQGEAWIVPAVQTIHILAIAILMASALMIALHALGLTGVEQSTHRVSARFLPCIWWALLTLFASGLVMIIGEPARSLANWVFQLKMSLLVVAIIVTCLYQSRVKREPGREDSAIWSGTAKALATLSLLLWIGIVVAGRWIAYT